MKAKMPNCIAALIFITLVFGVLKIPHTRFPYRLIRRRIPGIHLLLRLLPKPDEQDVYTHFGYRTIFISSIPGHQRRGTDQFIRDELLYFTSLLVINPNGSNVIPNTGIKLQGEIIFIAIIIGRKLPVGDGKGECSGTVLSNCCEFSPVGVAYPLNEEALCHCLLRWILHQSKLSPGSRHSDQQ
jgi:hypothetical protein